MQDLGALTITDYTPGALGWVVRQHGLYYAREWQFGKAFEVKVAGELANFLDRLDPTRDLFQLAWHKGEIIASLSLDGSEDDAEHGHLRWFIAADAARGSGAGGILLNRAISFAWANGFQSIYLWTFAGLDPARRLYDRAGFKLEEVFLYKSI